MANIHATTIRRITGNELMGTDFATNWDDAVYDVTALISFMNFS